MINPKFRELMLAAETERWKFRFWFSNPESEHFNAQPPDAFVKMFIRALPLNKVETLNHAEMLLRDIAEPEHGIAAYEILDANRNGIVGYIEWP